MRPMRLAKREVQDPERIREIIDSCQVLHIGAQDDEGMFIVPVNFGYLWKEGAAFPSFYLHSAGQGRKAMAFCDTTSDDGVSVAIELECDRGNIVGSYSCAYSRSYVSVMGAGSIHKVLDDEERILGLQLLMQHAAPGAPANFTAEGIGRVAIFRIDVEQLSAKERAPKL